MSDPPNGHDLAKKQRPNGETRVDASAKAVVSVAPQHFSDLCLQHWTELERIVNSKSDIEIDGDALSLAHVVAIARYSSKVKLNRASQAKVQANRELVEPSILKGTIIYGVSTGFGGSADTRTTQTQQLQRTLIRELHYGILVNESSDQRPRSRTKHTFRGGFNVDYAGEQECTHLPRAWARASVLIRMNSLTKGHSGVRPVILDRMSDLLNHDIIPAVPLRGSISASGDLSPLSYIGGAIQGKSTIGILGDRKRTAHTAFIEANLEPVTLQAKEGLAIVNGTAVSAGSASLAIHDGHGLLMLSQILTAMSVEALEGTEESFDPMFSEYRPHPGQIDSASTIMTSLKGSHFTKCNDGAGASLRQDRYSIRTAPQWLGPTIEDFTLAHNQMTVEMNSTTDNPIIDHDGRFLHGGNFQAKSVTNAMEKVRQGIQSIGRMLFSQCTELINPATNRGLPPNLVIEEPNSSFIFKGTDLNIAAFQSELGLLSNPCNHVMTAEMGNQSLNSLALISARYTHTAIDVLSQMVAVHLLALCQALDIRAIYTEFFRALLPEFKNIIRKDWVRQGGNDTIIAITWTEFCSQFYKTANMNTSERFEIIATQLRPLFWDSGNIENMDNSYDVIKSMVSALAASAETCWTVTRSAYLAHGSAVQYLGRASKILYSFVRDDLGIPLLCTDQLRTPSSGGADNATTYDEDLGVTVGTYNTKVYRAIKAGHLVRVTIMALEKIKADD